MWVNAMDIVSQPQLPQQWIGQTFLNTPIKVMWKNQAKRASKWAFIGAGNFTPCPSVLACWWLKIGPFSLAYNQNFPILKIIWYIFTLIGPASARIATAAEKVATPKEQSHLKGVLIKMGTRSRQEVMLVCRSVELLSYFKKVYPKCGRGGYRACAFFIWLFSMKKGSVWKEV